jgi:hypothetical protein
MEIICLLGAFAYSAHFPEVAGEVSIHHFFDSFFLRSLSRIAGYPLQFALS